MTWRFLPQFFIEIFASALSASAAYVAWRRRTAPGGIALALALLALAGWTLAAGLETAVVEQPAKILFSQIEYIGYVNAAPLLLLFVLRYTHPIEKITLRLTALLWVIPVIILALVWTNAWHGLIWTGFSIVSVVGQQSTGNQSEKQV